MKKVSIVTFIILISFLFLTSLFLLRSEASATTSIIIPTADITLDGNPTDWSSIATVFTDFESDDPTLFTGADIKSFKFAQDSDYVYVTVDFYDGPPSIELGQADYFAYQFHFAIAGTSGGPLENFIDSIGAFYDGSKWDLNYISEFAPVSGELTGSSVAVDSVIELAVPKNKLSNSFDFTFQIGSGDVSGNEMSLWVTLSLLPPVLDVPKYYQFKVNNPLVDPDWPNEQYDHLIPATIETIRKWGCALTSGVMVLRFHDVVIGPDPQNTPEVKLDVNPSTLNAWLKAETNKGYDKQGNVKWKSLNKYSSYRILENGLLDVGKVSLSEIKSKLNEDLANGLPVIIKTEYINTKGKTTPHYVVAKGKTGDTWFINDTASQEKETLAEDTYPRYHNKILGIRRFKPWDGTPVSGLTFYFASPAELLLIDPLGRRTGIDPETGQFISEISESSYAEDEIGADFEEPGTIGSVKVLDIRNPIDGNYQLQIIGTALGSYSLSTDTMDQTGGFQSVTIDGVINEEVISTFDVDYSSIPGELIEIERVATIPDAMEDVEISYKLGWITKEFVKKILIAKLEVAQRLEEQKARKLEHFDKLIEKAKNPKVKERYEGKMNEVITRILNLFIKEVKFYNKKGYLNDQALKLLIDNAQYIIEHLSL